MVRNGRKGGADTMSAAMSGGFKAKSPKLAFLFASLFEQ